MATSASTVGLPEDKAYIAHHFNCPTCCAAGLSGGKQARCSQGQTLWDAYNRATGFSNKASSTLHALHRVGMQDGIDHQPSEAGRKYFTAPKEKS
ncbi:MULTISPECIES: hypothetical protein [Comamonas]|uniref:hypothetical protein n=1 Tax=Comamonas TaxID=283 RepID=UPI0012C3DD5A|nr:MULTISPECIES: hypothetical protein [Comamonas]MDO1475615.1 hypothetical protein [Comamonas thiooxydans]MPT12829.1 hypothetical protein [Comamonas sp.]UUE95400.1 hypothetical protein MJ608_07105 [Comamonas thiooxydans]